MLSCPGFGSGTQRAQHPSIKECTVNDRGLNIPTTKEYIFNDRGLNIFDLRYIPELRGNGLSGNMGVFWLRAEGFVTKLGGPVGLLWA